MIEFGLGGRNSVKNDKIDLFDEAVGKVTLAMGKIHILGILLPDTSSTTSLLCF